MFGILLASILVSPATDSYFSDELLSLDNRRAKIEQSLPESENTADGADRKIKQLLALAEKYKKLEKERGSENHPYVTNGDGSITPLKEALFKRYQDIRLILNSSFELTPATDYTPEVLQQLIEEEGLDDFLFRFSPRSIDEIKAYLWLGDLAFEQGAFRQAAWAYEKFKRYLAIASIRPESILNPDERERLKMIDESISRCLRLTEYAEQLSVKKPFESLLEHFHLSKSLSIKSENRGWFYIPGTVLSELTFIEKRFSPIFFRRHTSKKKFTLQNMVTYPDSSLVRGNRIFILRLDSEQSVGFIVFDKKTLKPVYRAGEPLQKNIAYLHDIFSRSPKYLSAAVSDKNLYLLVEDTLFVLDNYSLEILQQRPVERSDLKLFSHDSDFKNEEKIATYFAVIKFHTLLAKLSDHSPEQELDVEGLSHVFSLTEYDFNRTHFLELWKQYPNFTLGSEIIGSLYKRAQDADFNTACEALALLFQIDSPEIWLDLKKQFKDSSSIDNQLKWYLTLANRPPQRFIGDAGELILEYNNRVNEFILKYGIRHRDPAARSASLVGIQRTYANSKAFAEKYARDIIKAIQLEPEPKIKADYLVYTRFIPPSYMKELSELFEEILKTESKTTQEAVLHALSYSRRSLTPALEQQLMRQLPRNDTSHLSSFQISLYGAIAGTISPDPSRRLDQLLSRTEDELTRSLEGSNTDLPRQLRQAIPFLLSCIYSTTGTMQTLNPSQTTRLLSVIREVLENSKKQWQPNWTCLAMIKQGWFQFNDVKGYLFKALDENAYFLRTAAEIFSNTYVHEFYSQDEFELIFNSWSKASGWNKDVFEKFCSNHILEFYAYLLRRIRTDKDENSWLDEDFYRSALKVLEVGSLAIRKEAVYQIFSLTKYVIEDASSPETISLAKGLIQIAIEVEPEQRAEYYTMFLELPNPSYLINTLKITYPNETSPERISLKDIEAIVLAKEKFTQSPLGD